MTLKDELREDEFEDDLEEDSVSSFVQPSPKTKRPNGKDEDSGQYNSQVELFAAPKPRRGVLARIANFFAAVEDWFSKKLSKIKKSSFGDQQDMQSVAYSLPEEESDLVVQGVRAVQDIDLKKDRARAVGPNAKEIGKGVKLKEVAPVSFFNINKALKEIVDVQFEDLFDALEKAQTSSQILSEGWNAYDKEKLTEFKEALADFEKVIDCHYLDLKEESKTFAKVQSFSKKLVPVLEEALQAADKHQGQEARVRIKQSLQKNIGKINKASKALKEGSQFKKEKSAEKSRMR